MQGPIVVSHFEGPTEGLKITPPSPLIIPNSTSRITKGVIVLPGHISTPDDYLVINHNFTGM